MIDFHTHILPEIDDGSGSIEESVALLRLEAEQGINTVILTPHFYARHESLSRFLQRRDEAYAKLTEALDDCAVSMHLGAEVYYFPGISESDILPQLAVEGTDLVMIEMPMCQWSNSMLAELAVIRQITGLTPVIAHIDRYIGPFRNGRVPEVLAEFPVLVQANAGSFLRRSTARLSARLLKEGKIHLLGSDCHNLAERKPNLGLAVETIEKRLGPDALNPVWG